MTANHPKSIQRVFEMLLGSYNLWLMIRTEFVVVLLKGFEVKFAFDREMLAFGYGELDSVRGRIHRSC